MRAVEKRESLTVLLIVIPVVLMFLYMSSKSPEIVVIDPPQQTVLAEQDLVLAGPGGEVKVGRTTREELMNVFPDGQNLGRSGMFHPAGQDLYITMSRKEEVVIRIDIADPNVVTSRGISTADNFDEVVEKYGSNYTLAYDAATPQKFDACYGTDQYILFKVEDDLVKKILIGGPVDPDLQVAMDQEKK